MEPSARQWPDIAEPYRLGAWSECARLVRSHVDRDPYDLATRALYASLLLREKKRSLALMQYERLLPLAVGQARLFRAIGTQRRLDDLHPPGERHPDRYRAIREWFSAFGSRRPTGRNADGSPIAGLLTLSPDSFATVTEQSQMMTLDLDAQVLSDSSGLLWVVFFGRVRWTLADAAGPLAEGTAGDGDAIYLPPGEPAERWLEIEPETPAEVIAFDPAIAAYLAIPNPVRASAGHAPEPDLPGPSPEPPSLAAAPAPDFESAPREEEPVPSSRERSPLVPAPRPSHPVSPAPRPRPDPLAEPMRAAGSGPERRRETRLSVLLAQGVALLGEAGTSVAPLRGTVVDVSLSGIGLRFPAAQIRHAGRLHPEAIVTVRIGLHDTGEVLPVTGRIAWIEWSPLAPGAGAEEARLGLEFVAMSAEKRSRLVHLLDAASRSGT